VKRFLVPTSAFSLVEVTLALGVAAFCLMAVFGLMPVGVQTHRNATSQTRATNYIAEVIEDLRATNKAVPNSSLFLINIPTDPRSPVDPPPCSGSQTFYLDGEGRLVFSPADYRYRAVVTFVKNPNATATMGATFAKVRVSWPASVDPCATRPSGSVEMFAAIDRR